MSEAAREEIASLMRELENQPLHVSHVTALALQLFDQLTSLHGCGERPRLLLQAAGHLHDIGHQYDYLGTGHHKESARLIREYPWKNFSPAEVMVIAQIARYHRKSIPGPKHDDFAALSESDQQSVRALAALLRVADALDRSHDQNVSSIRVEVLPNQLVFHLEARGPVWREVITAQKKGDLAHAVFQRDLVFKVGGELVKPEPPR
jgi:exopolyphosphatase/guanosine-5'-triphosphate,3'-diphosphate pyrophosphatase